MLLHGQIRMAEEKRSQDDSSDGGTEEGEVRVGALGGEGGAVWAVRDGGRHRWFFCCCCCCVAVVCCCCVLLLLLFDVLGHD